MIYHDPIGRICFSRSGRSPPPSYSDAFDEFFLIWVKPTTPIPSAAGMAYHSVFVFLKASESFPKKDFWRCCCCCP